MIKPGDLCVITDTLYLFEETNSTKGKQCEKGTIVLVLSRGIINKFTVFTVLIDSNVYFINLRAHFIDDFLRIL